MTSSILNGPSNTQAALQENDEQAFYRLLRSMVKAGVEVEGFEHSVPVTDPANPTQALIEVGIAPAKSMIDYWGYQDKIQLTYRRIPMSAMVQRYGSILRADLPVTVKTLMQGWFDRAGLYDRSEQFVEQSIATFGQHTMTIKDGQFLLYGGAPFEVKPLQRQLIDVLPNRTVTGFRTPTDFDTNVKAVLLSQLTAANPDTLPYPLEIDRITLSPVEVMGGYAHDNSRIRLTASGEGYYLGDLDVIYSRLDFGWYTMGDQIYMEGPPLPTLNYILNQASTQTGFPLSSDDVVATTFSKLTVGDLATLTIAFKPQNLRYVGELTIDYRAV